MKIFRVLDMTDELNSTGQVHRVRLTVTEDGSGQNGVVRLTPGKVTTASSEGNKLLVESGAAGQVVFVMRNAQTALQVARFLNSGTMPEAGGAPNPYRTKGATQFQVDGDTLWVLMEGRLFTMSTMNDTGWEEIQLPNVDELV